MARVMVRREEQVSASNGRGAARFVDQQEVARVAYELYLQRGGVNGHDVEDWLRAETIVRARAQRF